MRRYFLISRIKDADTRKNLETDDRWDQQISFGYERAAIDDFNWLTGHSKMREYKMFCITYGQAPEATDGLELDDKLPWEDEIAYA